MLYWESAIRLPQPPGLEPGEYELGLMDEQFYAFRSQQRYPYRMGR